MLHREEDPFRPVVEETREHIRTPTLAPDHDPNEDRTAHQNAIYRLTDSESQLMAAPSRVSTFEADFELLSITSAIRGSDI
jgi:hypothetical protein